MKRVYYNRKKITEITGGKDDPTLSRWEKKGLFPKRRKIGPNSVGWPSDEVDPWYENPEAWVQANQQSLAS